MLDYHVHALAHGEYSYTRDWIDRYIDCAHQVGVEEIGFCEHDEFIHLIDLDLFKSIRDTGRHNIKLKLGLELDFTMDREELIPESIPTAEYDYIIGSVHFIDGWGFDHPDHKSGYDDRDIDEIYHRYTEILMASSACRQFDIVGHIDLVKIWGHRPRRKSVLAYLDPVLKSIKYHGLAVEINSGGLRKPVGELYPSSAIVERMYDYDIPVTLGSDAHHPEQIGSGLIEAYRCARRAGYQRCVTFSRRVMTVVPLQY
ncbi:MAG TPA: histidinol-phosphatase HisJ family protein [Syntrophomonadaceae bacterium]|nr:histidinol-phosphatase HisJ family protein [Syntrophomonadaceae bacterium]